MYIDSKGFELFGHFVNWYGVIIAFGMALGVLLALKLAKKRNIKAENIIDLALICIPSAILGARLYYCIFYEHNYSFIEFFKIWEGGLAIYGGVIGGAIGLTIYCIVKKINFLKLADCIVPALILGQAMGRWGNFTNQEAYGNLITDPSLQWFPFGVLIDSNNFTPLAREAVSNAFVTMPGEAWFMATFFYESMWNFMVLGLLLFIFYKTNIKGLTTCGYFVLYGLGRLWIEGLRMDSLYFLGLRVSQWLSLLLIIAFASLAIYLIRKAKLSNQKIFNFKKKQLVGVGGGDGNTTQDLQVENMNNTTLLNKETNNLDNKENNIETLKLEKDENKKIDITEKEIITNEENETKTNESEDIIENNEEADSNTDKTTYDNTNKNN